MAPEHVLGHPELFARGPHLVLEELAQGLDELEVHLLGQAADVVVALDDGARPLEADALDDVGVERALHEPPGAGHPLRLFLEDLDEDAADDLPLLLRIAYPRQRREKPRRARRPRSRFSRKLWRNVATTCSASPCRSSPLSTKMHVSRSPRALWQRTAATGRVDPAREAAEHVVAVGDLGFDRGDGFVGERTRRPRRPEPGHIEEERCQHVRPSRRVDHLRVELDAVDSLARVADGAERRVAADADGLKARRESHDPVTVRHPDVERLALGESVEDALGPLDHHAGVAVFASARALDAPAEKVRDELQPVADAEDGHAELEDARVHGGRALGVDARRASRQDDGFRSHRAELLEREGAGLDLAVDALLANPAGDELGVLSPEVEDENELAGRRRHG